MIEPRTIVKAPIQIPKERRHIPDFHMFSGNRLKLTCRWLCHVSLDHRDGGVLFPLRRWPLGCINLMLSVLRA